MRRPSFTLPPFAARAALALALVALAPGARAADEPQGGDAASKRAQNVTRLNAEGTAFFKARDYRKALDRFNEAYALEAEPDLLYNIARCHEALGETSVAIEKYNRYLEQPGADAEGRARAEEKLRSLKQAQASAAARAGAAAPGPPGPKAPPGRSFSPWTWVTLGLGGAAAVGGGVAFFLGARDHSKVTDAGGYGEGGPNGPASTLTRARAEELIDAGDTKKTVGVALWGVGGAALVTSAVLFLLERPKPGERAASAGFAPTPGGGLLSFQKRF